MLLKKHIHLSLYNLLYVTMTTIFNMILKTKFTAIGNDVTEEIRVFLPMML